MELQEKMHKKIKALKQTGNLSRVSANSINLKLFRSWVKENHSMGREFKSLAVQGKNLLTETSLITPTNDNSKFMQSIRITNTPPLRIKKWNQLRQFR